ncbi:competence protein ComJ [Bacillus sp. UMB0893]|uniref:competence protein ComJ n=1 Tax=Bacillus sp. UMB0893 TaxID=2066053 RepID=UPI000C781972|nr:competence protein ComJ [Bacillus sp. UMB0893]PLR69438.1 DNA-entry nuclease [Bacillus sp. UMB0893]
MEKIRNENELLVSYHQITVSQAGKPAPHMEWSKQDLENQVTLEDIKFNNTPEITCRVPFQVLDGKVEIKSILSRSLFYEVPSGNYYLSFYGIPVEEKRSNGLYKVKYILQFTEAGA